MNDLMNEFNHDSDCNCLEVVHVKKKPLNSHSSKTVKCTPSQMCDVPIVGAKTEEYTIFLVYTENYG